MASPGPGWAPWWAVPWWAVPGLTRGPLPPPALWCAPFFPDAHQIDTRRCGRSCGRPLTGRRGPGGPKTPVNGASRRPIRRRIGHAMATVVASIESAGNDRRRVPTWWAIGNFWEPGSRRAASTARPRLSRTAAPRACSRSDSPRPTSRSSRLRTERCWWCCWLRTCRSGSGCRYPIARRLHRWNRHRPSGS